MAPVRKSHVHGADLRLLALAFLAGVLALFTATHLPSPLWAAPLLLAAVPRWPGRLCCLFIALGFLTAWGHATWLLQDRLPPSQDGRWFRLTGYVDSLPDVRSGRTVFVLRRTSPARKGVPRRLRLSWYNAAKVRLDAGSCWQLRVKLHAPRGLSNPGGFDYAGWLFRNDIGASGYVRHGVRCPNHGWHPLLRLRQRLRARLLQALRGQPMAGVILALTVGDRSAISRRQWRTLRATGTSHLVAISGLHVGMVATAAYLLVRWLWCWVPTLCLTLAAPRAAALAAVASGWGYAFLAGLGLPAQRAVIMLSVAMVALMVGRVVRASTAWALALLAVLAAHPFVVGSAGFWLSFGAVAWLIYLLSARVRQVRGWRRWAGLQGALLLALAPLTIGWFGRVALVGPVANSVLIPLFALLVPSLLVSVALLPLPWVGVHALLGVAWILEWLYRGLACLAMSPWASPHWGGHGLWPVVLALAGATVVLMPRGLPGRWMGLILCLPLMLRPATRLPAGTVRITLLDVGQGEAVVMRTRHHTALFDAGPSWRGGFDAGRSVVVPFLRWVGVPRLDRVLISHPDRDHDGGLGAVRRSLPITRLQGPVRDACRAGQHWRWDGVNFRVLHPADQRRWNTDNNASCVVRVSAGSHAALIAADIERPAERALVERVGRGLRADVVVVPHHGSDSSSSAALVAAVRPRWALVSAGHGNHWGFPRADVVARYRQAGAKVLNTANVGAIGVTLSSRGTSVDGGWRPAHHRLWSAR